MRDDAPSDSVYIDYAKLTSIVRPAVGTVPHEHLRHREQRLPRLAHHAARRQRHHRREPAEHHGSYAIADNQYRVVFDRNVTSGSATNTANYLLASFGSVDAAVMDGSTAVILTVSGTGLLHGQSETVTANNIVGARQRRGDDVAGEQRRSSPAS